MLPLTCIRWIIPTALLTLDKSEYDSAAGFLQLMWVVPRSIICVSVYCLNPPIHRGGRYGGVQTGTAGKLSKGGGDKGMHEK